jgi:hypothetical protein
LATIDTAGPGNARATNSAGRPASVVTLPANPGSSSRFIAAVSAPRSTSEKSMTEFLYVNDRSGTSLVGALPPITPPDHHRCEDRYARITGKPASSDPVGDIAPSLRVADNTGMRINIVIDTHIHADHRSAGRELAREVGVEYVLHADA